MASDSSVKSPVIFRLSATGLAVFILPLPTIGFIVCVLLSIFKDFEKSTWTHCGVKNWLPSISSAIGGYTPQRYIWRICIALHSAPRLLCAIAYYNQYKTFTITRWNTLYRILIFVNLMLNLTENMCLVVLSYVSSTENYDIHESSFIAFVVCSHLYMILQCILFRWSRAKSMTRLEQKSFRLKVWLCAANLGAAGAAAYFFYRHMGHCETGMYTLFAASEYVVVLTNIMYHGTQVLDCLNFKLIFYDPNMSAVQTYKTQ